MTLCAVPRQRFIGQNDFAGLGRGFGYLAMHVVGGGDIYQIYIVPFYQFAPVGFVAFLVNIISTLGLTNVLSLFLPERWLNLRAEAGAAA